MKVAAARERCADQHRGGQGRGTEQVGALVARFHGRLPVGVRRRLERRGQAVDAGQVHEVAPCRHGLARCDDGGHGLALDGTHASQALGHGIGREPAAVLRPVRVGLQEGGRGGGLERGRQVEHGHARCLEQCGPVAHAAVQRGRATQAAEVCAFDAALVRHDHDQQRDAPCRERAGNLRDRGGAVARIRRAVGVDAQFLVEKEPAVFALLHVGTEVAQQQPACLALVARERFRQRRRDQRFRRFAARGGIVKQRRVSASYCPRHVRQRRDECRTERREQHARRRPAAQFTRSSCGARCHGRQNWK